MGKRKKYEELDMSELYKKKRFRLSGSMVAKVMAFFLLAITCFTGGGSALFSILLVQEEAYTKGCTEVLTEALLDANRDLVYMVQEMLAEGRTEEAGDLLEGRNLDIEVEWEEYTGETKLIWSTVEGDGAYLATSMNLRFRNLGKSVFIDSHVLRTNADYLFKIYFDMEFPENDRCRLIYDLVTLLYEARYILLAVCGGSIFLFLISFIFLMCSAGHRNGREGIVPGALTGIHLDVLTAIFGFATMFIVMMVGENLYYFDMLYAMLAVTAVSTILAVWLTIYFMDFAIRVKLGKVWKHTLVYVILRTIWRILRFVGRGIAALVKSIPLVITTVIVFFGVSIVEFFGILLFMRDGRGVLLWMLEKIILLPIVVYVAVICKKLLKASKALADGQEDYRVDTAKMFGDFKEHGENLNSLGQGIAKAVSERMKSEHLKTELITNVSHDIKTPLTSIINYADLIHEEQSENPKIREYSEVLLRQSKRLKKLLEDLVDASKATTGNVEVNLEPCEVSVILSQAVGEYEQRMEENNLKLITRQPDEPAMIMADGRHLWRVLDNLLNNILKYAQENSRVYLSVEKDRGNVQIIFRNMSKYALEVSPEELQERFVRGDKSRHMEGNGLGLSIAKSLVELQNGQMEIVTDGDLFKVILSFRELAE